MSNKIFKEDLLRSSIKSYDRLVEKDLKEWDKVKCRICGKQISIIDAILVQEKYFICKKGH